jgi:hypothetical protein
MRAGSAAWSRSSGPNSRPRTTALPVRADPRRGRSSAPRITIGKPAAAPYLCPDVHRRRRTGPLACPVSVPPAGSGMRPHPDRTTAVSIEHRRQRSRRWHQPARDARSAVTPCPHRSRTRFRATRMQRLPAARAGRDAVTDGREARPAWPHGVRDAAAARASRHGQLRSVDGRRRRRRVRRRSIPPAGVEHGCACRAPVDVAGAVIRTMVRSSKG